jgi:hypothetical protein
MLDGDSASECGKVWNSENWKPGPVFYVSMHVVSEIE